MTERENPEKPFPNHTQPFQFAPGRGKRGGYRVIYYVKRADGVIWLLTMYPKNVAGNIPANVLKKIREEVEDG